MVNGQALLSHAKAVASLREDVQFGRVAGGLPGCVDFGAADGRNNGVVGCADHEDIGRVGGHFIAPHTGSINGCGEAGAAAGCVLKCGIECNGSAC